MLSIHLLSQQLDSHDSKYDLTISDLLGRTVYYEKFQNNFIAVSVSGIGEGVFIYKLKNDEGNVYTGKIILMR